MKHGIDYSLYLCTDRRLMTSPTIEASAESALRGGTTVIQLREKDCSSREFYELGLRVKKITERYNAPLIINDRVDIALAVGAAGVHVGQGDLPCKVVREIVGPDMIVGVSAATLDEAVQAEEDGADYLGVGAMYATATKTDTRPVLDGRAFENPGGGQNPDRRHRRHQSADPREFQRHRCKRPRGRLGDCRPARPGSGGQRTAADVEGIRKTIEKQVWRKRKNRRWR